MDKRYQIFVSSTYLDLISERQAVSQTLLSLNHFPAGMELFPASNEDQWTLIKGVIDDSDYYIIVIGGRYGSTGEDGLSYTEKEFDYALEMKIPILAFVHGEPGKILVEKTDQNDFAREKLNAFRSKVLSGRTAKFWTTPENLSVAVFQAVSAETKKNPREGWIRASQSGDPAKLNELREQVDQLKILLAQASTSAPAGTEDYEQGSDEFLIEYEFKATWNGARENGEVKLSWNDIFYELGPIMLDEAAESALRRRLSEEVWRYDGNVMAKPYEINVDNDSFDTIKIQLMALGLMKKSDKKHVPSDTNRYWQITPYGEQYLVRLRAKKKPTKD